jgi:hypothetical protein
MVVVNWLQPRTVEPVSHMDSTIAVLMKGRPIINIAIVLSMWLTGFTFPGGSQLTTTTC